MADQIIPMLSGLVQIESTQDKPEKLHEVIDFIGQWWNDSKTFKKYVFNGKPSAVISLNPAQSPLLLLNGHADVVPGTPDQFKPSLKNGRLFGRGSQDMKSGLATMLVLLKNLRLSRQKLPIALMIVTDEEIGGFDGTKKLLQNLSLKPKFFIAGEPTDLKIEYEAKGISWVKVKTAGRRAHGAYPWDGQNAIKKLSEEISAIYKAFPEPDHFVWESTCNLGKISGGQAVNQVPGEAEATLDIRRIPTESTPQIVSRLKEHLVYSNTRLEVVFDEPSHHTDQNEPAVKLLANVIKSVTKKPAEFVQKCGASDARHASSIGIPAVCFGPTGSGLHTDSEWVKISSLNTYHQALEKFTLEFCPLKS